MAKRSLFRIYRDVRFGKDKTPYKTNWGGGLKRATTELRGGYYYQIGIKGSFVMGGFFDPSPKDLLHIRNQMLKMEKSFTNFITNLVSGLIAYSFCPQKPAIKSHQILC